MILIGKLDMTVQDNNDDGHIHEEVLYIYNAKKKVQAYDGTFLRYTIKSSHMEDAEFLKEVGYVFEIMQAIGVKERKQFNDHVRWATSAFCNINDFLLLRWEIIELPHEDTDMIEGVVT